MLPNLLHNYDEHLMKKIPMFTVLQLQGTVQRHTRVPDQQIKNMFNSDFAKFFVNIAAGQAYFKISQK